MLQRSQVVSIRFGSLECPKVFQGTQSTVHGLMLRPSSDRKVVVARLVHRRLARCVCGFGNPTCRRIAMLPIAPLLISQASKRCGGPLSPGPPQSLKLDHRRAARDHARVQPTHPPRCRRRTGRLPMRTTSSHCHAKHVQDDPAERSRPPIRRHHARESQVADTSSRRSLPPRPRIQQSGLAFANTWAGIRRSGPHVLSACITLAEAGTSRIPRTPERSTRVGRSSPP